MTYVLTNEYAHHVWEPYIRNVGGGYVGVGADQNYTLIAIARSQWVWLFDYDPKVPILHKLIQTIALECETPQEFFRSFSEWNWKTTRKMIQEKFQDQPKERRDLTRMLRVARKVLFRHYRRSQRPCRGPKKAIGWLRNPEHYRYIRLLFQQGRVQAINGNMLTEIAMPSIAESARHLGVPIRIYYPSNAEENWTLSRQYRKNVMGLPFDERSVVLRTRYSKSWEGKAQGMWHYIVHGGTAFQQGLKNKGFRHVRWFMEDRLPTSIPYLSVIRLPGGSQNETGKTVATRRESGVP
jgi:hypothetical protein